MHLHEEDSNDGSNASNDNPCMSLNPDFPHKYKFLDDQLDVRDSQDLQHCLRNFWSHEWQVSSWRNNLVEGMIRGSVNLSVILAMHAILSDRILTYQDMSEVNDREILWEVPHLSKRHHQKSSVDDQADHATSDAEDWYLKELETLPMQDFQSKKGACGPQPCQIT